MAPTDSMLILFIQASLIIALSPMMGLLFARMRQPQVVGEMMAGIMLGPTLLGALAPAFHLLTIVDQTSKVPYAQPSLVARYLCL